MRESIGGTWLFTIVIAFVVLFTGYLCFSINYTKAFKTKDQVIQIISRNNGFENPINELNSSNPVIGQIVNAIQNKGYRTSTKSCPDDTWYGFDRDGNQSSRGVSFCLREVNADEDNTLNVVYYQVILFYKLDLPVFSNVLTFETKGDTKLIYK